MPQPSPNRIHTVSPRITAIRKKGYTAVDMHVHTAYSDGSISVPSLLRRAEDLGIGVAITDHDGIRGVLEADEKAGDALVIPGIELSSREGPHILLYFYSARDLAGFYSTFIEIYRRKSPYLTTGLPVEKILLSAEEYSCVKIAAHPFGYFGLDRGILKCVENGTLSPQVLDHIDGIEVICGGMGRELNDRAARYAGEHDLPITGGTDAHVLSSVGGVVTGVKADTVKRFLDGILARKSIVIGQEADPLNKGMTAAVIAWRFVPQTVTLLQIHYEQDLLMMKRYLDDLLR